MKSLLIIFLALSFLQADELQRIESIINDIAKLRVEHEECQRALELKGTMRAQTTKEFDGEKYEKNIETLREKNSSLEKNIQNQTLLVQNSQKEIKKYKNLLKTKENEIKTLKNQLAILEKKKENEPKIVVKEVIKKVVIEKKMHPKDENIFPTLMPKNSKFEKKQELQQETKPTTYRLKEDSFIYNNIDGDEIYTWEKDRTFTSNAKTQNYILITGYFVDREWMKAEEELWIKKADVFER